MRTTAEDWPIAMSTMPLSSRYGGGDPARADVAAWADGLFEIAEAGFRHVELTDAWLPVADLDPGRRADLRSALEENDLGVVCLAASRRSVLDPEDGPGNLAYSHRVVEAAAEFGAGVVCFGLHRPLTPRQKDAFWFWLEPGEADATDEDTWSLAVSRLGELGQHCLDVGVQMSLEVYEDSLLGTVDGCLRMVEEIGLDNVGLNPDLANLFRLHRRDEPWDEAYQRLLPVSNYWHVKNYAIDHDPATGAWFSTPTSLELGAVNYRHVLALAIDLGYDGPLCCEHYGGDGISVGGTNLAYLRRMLALRLRKDR